jgi:hypothetical protein
VERKLNSAIGMIATCLLAWCLGHELVPTDRITFTQDIRDPSRTERTFAYEFRWLVVGFVGQAPGQDALFAGVLPLKVTGFNGYLSFDGGAIVATEAIPEAGTHANFMARIQLRLTNRVAVAYWHWSNAELGDRNPAVDSLGVTVRLGAH